MHGLRAIHYALYALHSKPKSRQKVIGSISQPLLNLTVIVQSVQVKKNNYKILTVEFQIDVISVKRSSGIDALNQIKDLLDDKTVNRYIIHTFTKLHKRIIANVTIDIDQDSILNHFIISE